MKISSSNLQMDAAHAEQKRREVRESVRMWSGQPPANALGGQSTAPTRSTVQLSRSGLEALAAEQNGSADKIQDDIRDKVENDPKTQLIRSVIQILTGREAQVFDSSELRVANQNQQAQNTQGAANAPANFGAIVSRTEVYQESEQTRFQAEGSVKTADGKEINFKIDLAMSRSYREESSSELRLGNANAKKTDPLVLNFSGKATELTDQRFAFDLNSDGRQENINFVAQGSGFLVFDRNNDGKVNNGKELFGPTSNNGFAELAQLDDDHNGWIDENDSAFKQLKIWSQDENGNKNLQSLAAAGVGAIALDNIATPFELKNSSNQLEGAIRSTGVFLQENGNTGTIQQIDLTA